MDNLQGEFQQTNQALYDRMAIIDEQLKEYQKQSDRLLDLYHDREFPKEILTERKSRVEQMLGNLQKEKNNLAGHIRKVSMTDDQLLYIEAFCAKIRKRIDQADINTKRKIIELLDIRSKIALKITKGYYILNV